MFVYIYTGVNQETKEIMQTKEVCLPSVFTLCRYVCLQSVFTQLELICLFTQHFLLFYSVHLLIR